MSRKDNWGKSFDLVYEIMKRKYPDIRFPSYGERFYYKLTRPHIESIYIYLTQSSLIYTASSTYITEIQFNDIKKISIKRGLIFKSSYHIRIVADKKYHLLINVIKDFSTTLTGNNAENVKNLIDTLKLSVR